MATVIERCTTEEQRSVLRFSLWAKELMHSMFINKYFLFTVGNICRIKRFTTGWQRFADEGVETKVRK
jgi:hypothetical protein